jgi:DNA primase
MQHDLKDKILSHYDIVDVVSEHVTLKKRGGKYWGLCPFHKESAPSFSVDQPKQMFYCFGCKENGNVIDFVIKTKGLSYREAVDELCEKAGIERPERETRQNRSEIRAIYDAGRIAMNFFVSMLKSPKGAIAFDYIKARGLKDEIIKTFSIGYAPDEWDALILHLKKSGISEEIAFKAGLTVERKSGGYYDRFRNRVMFPIIDRGEEVVAFGGRVLDGSEPKYLNSPETPVFEKKRVLYNLNNARNLIKNQGVVVVEGYMDVVSLANAGFLRAVAALGTSFSEDHVRLLKRFTDSITLVFDGDAAGRNATHRALEQFLSTDIIPRVAILPEGMDPDDLARKDINGWNKILDEAATIWDFIFDESFKKHNASKMEGKKAILTELTQIITKVKDIVLRDMLEERLSERTGIKRDTVSRLIRGKGDVKINETITIQRDPLEDMFGKLILLDTDAIKILSVFNLAKELRDEDISMLAGWVLEHGNCIENHTACPEKVRSIAQKLLGMPGIEGDRKKALSDITGGMLARRYDRELKELQKMLTEADKDLRVKLFTRKKFLEEERKNIPQYITEALGKNDR